MPRRHLAVAKRVGICWRVVTRARSEEGVALVEFALILPVLALLLFGMLDFGKAFNYWIDETHLANEGARWAVVNKNPGLGRNPAGVHPEPGDYAGAPERRDAVGCRPRVQVCIEFPRGTSNVGDPVRVTVTATYNWLALIAQRLERYPDRYQRRGDDATRGDADELRSGLRVTSLHSIGGTLGCRARRGPCVVRALVACADPVPRVRRRRRPTGSSTSATSRCRRTPVR